MNSIDNTIKNVTADPAIFPGNRSWIAFMRVEIKAIHEGKRTEFFSPPSGLGGKQIGPWLHETTPRQVHNPLLILLKGRSTWEYPGLFEI